MLQVLSELTTQEFATYIGTLSSVIGLILTVAVFFRVDNIRREYILRARLPQITKNLRDRASSVSELARNYLESQDDLLVTLARTEADVTSLMEKASSQLRPFIKLLLKQTRAFRTSKKGRFC